MPKDRMRFWGALLFFLFLTLDAQAREGWRLGEPLPEEGIVELEVPVRFSGQIVAGTPHLVTLEDRKLRFTDVWGMREVARVGCKIRRFQKWQSVASLETRRSGGLANPTVKLVFRYGHLSCTVHGRAEPGAKLRETKELRRQGELARAEVAGIPRVQTYEEVLYRALARFIPSLEHCAKSGEKSKWQTDDARFVGCACPIVLRWPLPVPPEATRVSMRLLDFAFGVSLSVSPGAKPTECRVWAGRKPPEGEPVLLGENVRALRSEGN